MCFTTLFWLMRMPLVGNAIVFRLEVKWSTDFEYYVISKVMKRV